MHGSFRFRTNRFGSVRFGSAGSVRLSYSFLSSSNNSYNIDLLLVMTVLLLSSNIDHDTDDHIMLFKFEVQTCLKIVRLGTACVL